MSKQHPTTILGADSPRSPDSSEANTSEALVAPVFRRLRSRGGALDDGTPCHKDLVPFVQSFDFTLLAAALRKRPLLYFDPAVRAQIAHLLHLRDNEEEWERVGWDVHVDDFRGVATPDEVEHVESIL